MARNTLSHGSGSFEPQHLAIVADILERMVRPHDAQERAAKKDER